MFLNININKTSGARFEFYKKPPLILGAAVQRCSGSIWIEVNCHACNFTLQAFSSFYKDFDHIFLTCSEKFINISKLGKIFRCVTSFYQYCFVRDKSCYHKTNSGLISNQISIERNISKTSRKHLKRDVFFATSLRRLKYISEKISFFVASLIRLKYISEKMSFLWPL